MIQPSMYQVVTGLRQGLITFYILRWRSIVTSMNKDLQSIIEWGDTNLVKFNSSKTQCTVFSLKHKSFKPSLIFNEAYINADESLSIYVGLQLHLQG